ncbi:hypothetical protein BDV59DRAFT_172575 [Aspergillus ambiguus]|uniref:uncharacterized protein n=1 Tax=Aspergillus ambiguus TaxID=176160 RepID=UPI003CCE378F
MVEGKRNNFSFPSHSVCDIFGFFVPCLCLGVAHSLYERTKHMFRRTAPEDAHTGCATGTNSIRKRFG